MHTYKHILGFRILRGHIEIQAQRIKIGVVIYEDFR